MTRLNPLERPDSGLFLCLTRATFDTAAIGMFWFLPDGRFFRVNQMSCLMTGYSEEELLSLSVQELTGRYSPELWVSRWRELREKKKLRYESQQRHKDGHIVPTEIDVSFVEFEGAEFGVGFARDITERKRYEESLHQKVIASEQAVIEASERFNVFVQNSRTAFWMTAADCQTIEYASPVFLQIFGFDPDASICCGEHWYSLIHPVDRAEFDANRELVGRGERVQSKYRIIRADGQIRWIRSHAFPVRGAQGEIRRFAGVLVDITEHEEADLKLSAALAEREVLLHEIHHRVKNNLQIISSLLRLQSSTAPLGVISALQESRNRIEVIAELYEHLYRSENLSRVRFSAYAKQLISKLVAMFQLTPETIDVTLDAKSIELDPQTTVLCGLILNELLTNSVKYAFPDGESGKIEIRVYAKDQETVVLSIHDNGVGLSPSELDTQYANALGIKLVRALTRQLKGTMSVANENGTTVRIEFPVARAGSIVPDRTKLAR